MSIAIYESVTNQIIKALEHGVVPWKKPWSTVAGLPMNPVSGKTYRGVNVFLLSLSPYADHRWLTFNQVQGRSGRIRQGEKSTMVVFWKQWQPRGDEDMEGPGKQVTIPLLRYYKVFNVEQTEGLGLPELYIPTAINDHQQIERAELLINSMPNPPRIQRRGRAAWYRPADDLVQVPPLEAFAKQDAFYATMFHELGHATGAATRLNRPGVTETVQFGSGEYSKEELVAELTAAYCTATLSMDNTLIADSASYIQGWLSILRSDPKAVVIAAAQAQRAADYIRGLSFA